MKTVDKECLREDIGCAITDIVPILERIDKRFSSLDDNDLDVSEIKKESFSKILKYSKFLTSLVSSSNSNDIKIAKPEIEVITSLDSSLSVDDRIKSLGLDWFNVHSCLDSLAGGMIPVLVGIAGAGKTYTAVSMSHIIWKFASDLNERTYDKLYKVMVPCSNISHNDFWGSFDAVSHMCTGRFKYIWQEALSNPNDLYYVILDEMLDMYDIRSTYGESFSMITLLPDNLIVVATGNSHIKDKSSETGRKMLEDDGIKGRFELINVHNILQDISSDEYKKFFEDFIDTSTPLEEKLKCIVLRFDKEYADKMLVPRNVISFIKRGKQKDMSEQDYLELLCKRVRENTDYIKDSLFVDLPCYSSSNNDALDILEEIWNEED